MLAVVHSSAVCCYLADFGLAVPLGADGAVALPHGAKMHPRGTRGFRCPAMAAAPERVGAAADVFSFGRTVRALAALTNNLDLPDDALPVRWGKLYPTYHYPDVGGYTLSYISLLARRQAGPGCWSERRARRARGRSGARRRPARHDWGAVGWAAPGGAADLNMGQPAHGVPTQCGGCRGVRSAARAGDC